MNWVIGPTAAEMKSVLAASAATIEVANCEKLALVIFCLPELAGGPSDDHANNIAGGVPNAENGGNPLFLVNVIEKAWDDRPKDRQKFPTLGMP